MQGAAIALDWWGKIDSDADCYVSAEIPPAGAPAGFDSAAIVNFSVHPHAVAPLRSE